MRFNFAEAVIIGNSTLNIQRRKRSRRLPEPPQPPVWLEEPRTPTFDEFMRRIVPRWSVPIAFFLFVFVMMTMEGIKSYEEFQSVVFCLFMLGLLCFQVAPVIIYLLLGYNIPFYGGRLFQHEPSRRAQSRSRHQQSHPPAHLGSAHRSR